MAQSIWHLKFPKVVLAHTLGDVGNFCMILLSISSRTCTLAYQFLLKSIYIWQTLSKNIYIRKSLYNWPFLYLHHRRNQVNMFRCSNKELLLKAQSQYLGLLLQNGVSVTLLRMCGTHYLLVSSLRTVLTRSRRGWRHTCLTLSDIEYWVPMPLILVLFYRNGHVTI